MKPQDGKKAYQQLLNSIEQYFLLSENCTQATSSMKVMVTILPPIFLQRPGHSMTIVGLVFLRDGSRELLVFDPAYAPPLNLTNLACDLAKIDRKLHLPQLYCRGKRYLKKYTAFETLRLIEVISG